MKYNYFLFFLLFGVISTGSLSAQTVTIDEDFSDGDFTNNPTWTDNESKHIINGANLLQLDAPESNAEAAITTPSTAAYGEWEALVQLGFNPSGSNLSRFYLVSNSDALKGELNGYFIEVGGTDDEVSLYRQDGSNSTKIIDGTDGLVDSDPVTVRIRATRGLDGNWELLADNTGGTTYTSQGTTSDNTYTSSNFLGFLSDYTSTRSDLFEYDEIVVTKVTPPLDIQTTSAVDNQTIDLTFNLDIEGSSLAASDFSINNGIGNPSTVSLQSSNVVRLSYTSPIQSDEYTVTINDINDTDGNTIAPNTTASFTLFGTYAQGDVIINEFMKDPPSGQQEYVELRNTSSKILNLQNWALGDDGGTSTISSDETVIEANGLLVISPDTTALFNTYGSRSYIEMSGLASLNNGGDVVQLNTNNGTQVDSLRYTSNWGGSDVALERRSATTPSIYQENWGDSPNANGGTPGRSNEIAQDNTAPQLSGLRIVSNQILKLAFDERLESSSAADVSNYSITGSSINSATPTEADSVELLLGSNLQNAQSYTINVSGVEDIFGNAVSSIDTSITYYNPTPVDSGDVAINEFMSAPPSGSSEYIEIYNHSSKSLDLQGWSLSDDAQNQDVITNSQFIVPPDSFVVITPDNTLESEYPESALLIMSEFPSLNNGGDAITIRAAGGTLLDSLTYSSDWGSNEVALERRSVDTPGIFQSNWADAPNGLGTPGFANQIQPDTQSPELESLLVEQNQLTITFSERPDRNTAEDIANYTLSGGISITDAVFASPDTVRLPMASGLQDNSTYTFSIENITDIFGNIITPTDSSFTFYNPSPVDSGDVVINEFMSAPPSNSSEYIEIYNHSSKSLDLQGWTLSDAGQNRDVITSSQFIVPPDSFAVIAPDNTLESEYPESALLIMSDFPSLNNGGDVITIRDGNSTLLDSLTYSSDWGSDEVALERRSVDVPAVYQSNWGNTPNGFGTPGFTNEIPTNTTPPELESLFIEDNQLTLTFSDPLGQSSAENTGNFTLSGGINISNATFASPDSVFLTPNSNLQNNTSYTLSIENVADIFGNAIAPTDTSFTFYEVSPSDSGDVAINEFMSAPPSNSSEYIEIYNHSSKSLDLQGWTLSDNGQNEDIITNKQFIVPPDSFAVIAPDNTLESDYPNISLVVMNAFPSLNNGGDQITITNSSSTLLDSLAYRSDWGSDEIALERRSFDVAGFYQPNWGESPNGFGTPGRANEVPTDTKSPELTSLTIENSDLLSVTYSERISQLTAKNLSNYTISGSPTIAGISFSAPDSAFLQLDSDLQNAVDYTLSIQNIEDIFGNAITPTDSAFTFYELSPVSSGDVFINEFSYEPTSGSTEYIELYNPTEKSFNLQGWTLSDNRGNNDIITNTQFVVPPDSFVVIAPDNTLESQYPNIALVSMAEFPSLNNSGDDIVISDQNGAQLDSLQYTSAWGGSEVALERRTINTPGIFQENWGNAPNGFGTPGRANQVETDQTAPSYTQLSAVNDSTFQLAFSESITTSSATEPSNYQIDPNRSIKLITANDDSVTIFLNDPLSSGTTYQVTVSGLSDIFDNSLSSASRSIEYLEIQEADSGDIAINEIMYNPDTDSQADFVEIYNTSDKNISLQNWNVGDANRSTSISQNIPLQAGAYVVLTGSSAFAENISNAIVVDGFPSLNNSTADAFYLRNTGGTTIDSLRYSQSWGGSEAGTTLERRSIEIPASFRENWGTSPTPGGTPGDQNTITADETAPQLSNFQIIDSQQLDFIFSERIKSSSINNDAISISGNTSVDNITLLGSDTLSVTLSSDLQNDTDYTVTIEQITDIFDNTITTTDTTFTFYQVSPVSSGDVFVNEFSFDPISGSTEYVEIYNPTNKSFDLQGWTLSDNRGNKNIITNNQFIVPPDSFAVIARDNTLLSDYQDIALVSMPAFPSLNNSGDDIILHDENDTTLDSLRFTSDWGGNEVALERRTTNVSATFQENWGDTPNGFGTPGAANLIEPDNTAPTFEQLNTVDESTVQLIFSERITSSSASNQANYQITPNRDIQLIAANDDSVQLFLGQDLESGTTYEVVASNISDVFGNTLESTTKDIEYLQIDQAEQGDIVINEILYNPGSSEKADFIELYNTSTKNVDLTSWAVGDGSGTTSINQNIQLRAGGYIVLTGSTIFANNVGTNGYAISGFPSLNNSTPDAVYLRNQDGGTIDSLRYSQQWGGSEEGTSLERKDPLAASNDASNWETSSSENGSSGGQQNITFNPDTSPPEVIFSKVRTDGSYEVQFNEFIELTDNLRFLLDDQRLNIASFDSTNGNVIVLGSPQSQAKKAIANGTSIVVQNLTDVKGNIAQQSEVSVAQPMNSTEKDLVINEIMFNPLDEPDDNQADQSEYIELRNTRDYAISLEGLTLHDAPDEDGDIRELQPVSSTAKWVPAQGKVLVYAGEATTFNESMIANFFDLEASNMQSIMRVDRSSLSLASSGDAIFISDSTGSNVDSVYYDETWQNPNLIDTRGVSLERIMPGGPSNDDSNWGSSVNPKGGTPNQENSIYQGQSQTPDETGISFTPNPFTPDGDGDNDNLFINYKLDHQDYLIKVHIYDRYGRLVRELADGKQAGFEGQLIWDGRKGDGGRNRIGIYIVVFEAYDSSSGSDRAFKKTVVLARQLN